MSRRDGGGGNGTEDELGAPANAMRSTSRRSGRGRSLEGIAVNTPHANVSYLELIFACHNTHRGSL